MKIEMKIFLLTSIFLVVQSILLAQTTTLNLSSIEDRVLSASENLSSNKTGTLIALIDSLNTWRKNSNERFLNYWYCYSHYRLSTFYIRSNKSASKKSCETAIKVLESMNNKNSEEYVLLGSLISFSINFFPGKAGSLSPLARSYYDKAIELDVQNMRAYYAIARSDYYKPVEFGGGKIVEQNLLKALSLKSKHSENPISPSWGREDAYVLIINFYKREERKQDALIFCKRALNEFPQSSQLKAIQQKIE